LNNLFCAILRNYEVVAGATGDHSDRVRDRAIEVRERAIDFRTVYARSRLYPKDAAASPWRATCPCTAHDRLEPAAQARSAAMALAGFRAWQRLVAQAAAQALVHVVGDGVDAARAVLVAGDGCAGERGKVGGSLFVAL
jgi:hypothetical protein